MVQFTIIFVYKKIFMNVGIIGSGIVGRVLAGAFLKEGHKVMLGTRNSAKEEVLKFKKENPGAQTGSFDAAARFGELIVLAIRGSVAEQAIRLAGLDNFTGKVVIDATNPISADPPVNGVLKYFTSLDESLMERIQVLLPEAHLVKAFNSVGSAFMYRPDFNGIRPTMFIAGNNSEAKKTVSKILEAFEWDVEDMGMAEAARAIEPLCILWCIPGLNRNQWGHAFKLLKV
jgi:predicted dinucleotide-binding enzyme